MKFYEYFFDGEYITGYQEWNSELYPDKYEDCIDNPPPIPQMSIPGWQRDQYGNYRFKMIDNEIRYTPTTPTTEQQSLKEVREIQFKYLLKILAKGILDRNDPDFVNFLNKLNNIS